MFRRISFSTFDRNSPTFFFFFGRFPRPFSKPRRLTTNNVCCVAFPHPSCAVSLCWRSMGSMHSNLFRRVIRTLFQSRKTLSNLTSWLVIGLYFTVAQCVANRYCWQRDTCRWHRCKSRTTLHNLTHGNSAEFFFFFYWLNCGCNRIGRRVVV